MELPDDARTTLPRNFGDRILDLHRRRLLVVTCWKQSARRQGLLKMAKEICVG